MSDASILGPASGEAWQAVNWLAPKAKGYTQRDCETIVAAYAHHGTAAGVDWFLALAQMAHETGSLTSWWCQRPRRNPCGFGVTGHAVAGRADAPPGPGWTWDGTMWREGWSFPAWTDNAVPAQIGRLLAYALRDEQLNDTQRGYVQYALALRPLPAAFRGVAPTITGLNGRWAVPGRFYGQRIIVLRNWMRGERKSGGK